MMPRWRESGRAPPLTLPTEVRRRRRVEPPKILQPPWRRKRRKPPGSLPKRPPSVSFLFSDIVSFICLIPVLMHFARFRKKATTSLKKSSKTLGASINIKDMLHRDSSPAIAPATPVVQPSSAPTSSQVQEAPGPSAMEVDTGASTELAIVGEQATQESAALQMAEAPAKDAIGSGKAVVGAGTSAEGGAPTPQKPFEFPKIVYPALTPSNTTLVAGGVLSYPTCGIEELLRQADILRGNSISFGKLLAESATNLKIIALVSFTLPFAFHYEYPTVAPEDVDGKP